jgi:small ligand-binding sensory domain FIST
LPAGSPFSYAIYRLVPRIERGEQINVGVVVFCRPLGYLAARTELQEARALALWPDLDVDSVSAHLAAIERVAAGDQGAGPMASLDTTARFHWLVAPSSTIIQPSEVHTGLCEEPDAQLARLYWELVTESSSPG